MALVALTCVLVLSVDFGGDRKLVLEQMQQTVKLIAADGAARVDVALHERVWKPGDEQGEAYREVESALRMVRDRYRAEGLELSYIYTVRPKGDGSGDWVYVMDAQEAGENKSLVGDPYTFEADDPLDAEQELVAYAYADRDFTHDQYGSWLSGNAPLKDDNGRVVAMLGVDVSADDVVAQIHLLFRQALIAGLLAVLIGIAGSVALARWATQPIAEIIGTLARIGKGKLSERVEVTRKDEFAELGTAVNTMARSLEQQLALKQALSRHVSRDLSRQIVASRNLLMTEGMEREVTILFCDIRNFERLGDLMPSEEVVAFLNDYFCVLIDAVFSNGGTLDKFSGDGFMATFGATGEDESHRASAVKAAIRIHSEHQRLLIDGHPDGEIPLVLGIGIHSGTATVEEPGESHTLAYSASGEAVDMAARIEGYNRSLGTCCLISGSTKTGLEGLFEFVTVSEVAIPSQDGPVPLFTIRDMVECRLAAADAS